MLLQQHQRSFIELLAPREVQCRTEVQHICKLGQPPPEAQTLQPTPWRASAYYGLLSEDRDTKNKHELLRSESPAMRKRMPRGRHRQAQSPNLMPDTSSQPHDRLPRKTQNHLRQTQNHLSAGSPSAVPSTAHNGAESTFGHRSESAVKSEAAQQNSQRKSLGCAAGQN